MYRQGPIDAKALVQRAETFALHASRRAALTPKVFGETELRLDVSKRQPADYQLCDQHGRIADIYLKPTSGNIGDHVIAKDARGFVVFMAVGDCLARYRLTWSYNPLHAVPFDLIRHPVIQRVAAQFPRETLEALRAGRLPNVLATEAFAATTVGGFMTSHSSSSASPRPWAACMATP